MRIGELAKKSGLSRDTIRFYERNGLITSYASQDPQNTYRHYPDSLLEDLEMIAAARNVGFSIPDLQVFLGANQDLQADDVFLDQKITELEQKLKQTRSLLAVLKQTRAALAKGPMEWRAE